LKEKKKGATIEGTGSIPRQGKGFGKREGAKGLVDRRRLFEEKKPSFKKGIPWPRKKNHVRFGERTGAGGMRKKLITAGKVASSKA